MLRTHLQIAALSILSLARIGTSLDLHQGLVEEWSIRTGGEPRSLNVEWIDSAAGDGGTTDWTAALVWRQGMKVQRDTVVLRVFDLAHLVDSGAYRQGNDAVWLKASCLLPFQLDDLDSVLKSLRDSLVRGSAYGEPFFPVINRTISGAMAEFCIGGRNKEVRDVARGGSQTVCFQGLASEAQDCRPSPRFRTAPGIGVVAWRSLQRQEDWRLVRFDGREVEHPPGALFARLLPGETWIWTQGEGEDPPLCRMTILERLEDSLGIPGWSVDVETRGGKVGAIRTTTQLRIDTLEGWVGLGSEIATPWAPYAKSTATRLALGFLADWGSIETDSSILIKDELATSVWGQTSRIESWTLSAVRDVGTRMIRSWNVTGPLPNLTSSDIRWTLVFHTSEPVSVQRKDLATSSLFDLRQRCWSRPELLLRRVAPDGRIESGRGAAAIVLLEKKGMAVFVVGEGSEERTIRTVVP